MKTPWQIMTVGDWIIAVGLLAFSLIGIGWLATSAPGSRVVVTSGEQTCFVANLDQYGQTDLEGPLGKTRLVIDEHGAYVTGSPCPRKLCISMGPAKYSGDLLACIPNRIMVRIENSDRDEASYDLLSR